MANLTEEQLDEFIGALQLAKGGAMAAKACCVLLQKAAHRCCENGKAAR